MTGKTLKKKMIAVFLAFAAAVTMIPGGYASITQDAGAASTITLKGKKFEYKDEYGDWHTNTHFTGGGYEGLCAKAHYSAITGSHSYTMHESSAYCKGNIMAKLAYYYGYKKGWTSGTNGAKLARCMNYVSTQSGAKDKGKAFNFKKKTLKAMVSSAKKVKVPEGFECWFVIPKGDSSRQAGVIWKYIKPGKLTVKKGSAVAGYKKSFAGCEYTLYKSDKKTVAGKLTCKADGTAGTLTVPPGTYYAKETKSNANYIKSDKWYKAKIVSSKKTTLKVSDSAKGSFALQKAFTPDSDDGYTLKGFKFRLTNTANSKKKYTGTTDAKGAIRIKNIPAGTYTVTELLTSAQKKAGYSNKGKQGLKVTIANGKTAEINWKNSYRKNHCLRIIKTTEDDTSAAGFRFDVKREIYSRELKEDTFISYAHIIPTQISGASGEDNFTFGDFAVNQEELAELNEAAAAEQTGEFTVHVTAQAVCHSETEEDITETVIVPVKVTLRPVTEKDQVTSPVTPASMPGPVGWRISYNDIIWAGSAYAFHISGPETTTDESGEIILDDLPKGIYTVTEVLTDEQKKRFRQPEPQTLVLESSKPAEPLIFNVENKVRMAPVTLKKTNAREGGDVEGFEFTLTGVRLFDGEAIQPVTAVTDENGIIDFGELYAGEYVLEETGFDPDNYMFHSEYRLEGYDNPARRFTVTGDETQPVQIDFENDPVTSLFLTKVDKDTQMFLENAEFELYENGKKAALFRIVRGKNGIAEAEILWKAEDTTVYADIADAEDDGDEADPALIDEEGEEEEADGAEEESDAADPNDGEDGAEEDADGGSDSDADAGAGSGDEAADDADMDEAGTETAPDYNYAVLKGLKRGAEYRIVETKAPDGYSTSINYGFTFEEDMQPIVLENEAPQIATRAADAETGLHMSNAGSGKVTIVDAIMYRNLTPGKEYFLTGRLVFKPETQEEQNLFSEEAKPVESDGKAVTKTVKLTPKKEDGTAQIRFTFDASKLEGKRTVIFEALKDPQLPEDRSVIASHTDTDNEDQSIYFPKLMTSASGLDTCSHITRPDRETVIVDTVDYSDVIAGQIYEIRGVLMDQNTGKPLTADGKEITSSVKFKATEDGPLYENEEKKLEADETEGEPAKEVKLVSGKVKLTFSFDGRSLAGKSAVAYEELYAEGKCIGQHKDLEDREQTVQLPSIGTTASAGAGVIRDKVEYWNLMPGHKYIMRGVMMDKSTGKPLIIDGEKIAEEQEFTPRKPDGSIVISFAADSSALQGKTLVAFETCYLLKEERIEIASHRDFNSSAQTVTIRSPREVIFGTPQTGQRPWWMLIPALTGALAAVCGGMLLRKRRGGAET